MSPIKSISIQGLRQKPRGTRLAAVVTHLNFLLYHVEVFEASPDGVEDKVNAANVAAPLTFYNLVNSLSENIG